MAYRIGKEDMKKTLAIAAAASLLAGSAAFGQVEPDQPGEVVWGDMHGNISAMQEAVDAEFVARGIDADVSTLTLDELSQIMLAFDDESMGEDESLQQIERILAGETAD